MINLIAKTKVNFKNPKLKQVYFFKYIVNKKSGKYFGSLGRVQN